MWVTRADCFSTHIPSLVLVLSSNNRPASSSHLSVFIIVHLRRGISEDDQPVPHRTHSPELNILHRFTTRTCHFGSCGERKREGRTDKLRLINELCINKTPAALRSKCFGKFLFQQQPATIITEDQQQITNNKNNSRNDRMRFLTWNRTSRRAYWRRNPDHDQSGHRKNI